MSSTHPIPLRPIPSHPIPQVIEGALPADLPSGVLLRNGPNPLHELGYSKRLHWFDGHAMVHSVRFPPAPGELAARRGER